MITYLLLIMLHVHPQPITGAVEFSTMIECERVKISLEKSLIRDKEIINLACVEVLRDEE